MEPRVALGLRYALRWCLMAQQVLLDGWLVVGRMHVNVYHLGCVALCELLNLSVSQL